MKKLGVALVLLGMTSAVPAFAWGWGGCGGIGCGGFYGPVWGPGSCLGWIDSYHWLGRFGSFYRGLWGW